MYRFTAHFSVLSVKLKLSLSLSVTVYFLSLTYLSEP